MQQLWRDGSSKIRVIRAVAATGEGADSFRMRRASRNFDIQDILNAQQVRERARESQRGDEMEPVSPACKLSTFENLNVRDVNFSSHIENVFDVLEEPDHGLWRIQSHVGEFLHLSGLAVAVASLCQGTYAAAQSAIGLQPSSQFLAVDGLALLVFVSRFNTSLVYKEVEVCSRRRVWTLLALSPTCYADAASFLHVFGGGLWHLLLALRMGRFSERNSVTLTVDFKLTFLHLTAILLILAHLVACFLLAAGGGIENDYGELYRDAIFLLVGLHHAPTVEADTVISCALVFAGTLSAGWILSSMLLAMDFAQSTEIEHRANIAKIQCAMESLELPLKLKERILRYKAYCHTRKSVGTLGSVFEDLSMPLKMEMRLFLYAELVMSVPFLKHACVEFIKRVTLALEELVFLPGDFIIVAGEQAKEMYFLRSGTVWVFSSVGANRLGVKIAELTGSSRRSFFGEVGLISDVRRMAHVRANTYVICCVLAKPTFCSLLEDFPEEAEAITNVAAERVAEASPNTSPRIVNSQPKSSSEETPSRADSLSRLSALINNFAHGSPPHNG
jgi:CRP-like cAMP-binding protein